MRCPNVGTEVSLREERCTECAIPLAVTCPTCGASLTHAGQPT